MSVGLLLVTHHDIGACLLQVAHEILNEDLPLGVKILSVRPDMPAEWLCGEIQALCAELETGDGVLILTDLYAATPCNAACDAQKCHRHAVIVSGLNLSMLLTVFNYAAYALEPLAEKAAASGHRGIIMIPAVSE